MTREEQIIADAFLQVIGTALDDTTLSRLADALERNELEEAFRAIGLQEAIFAPLIEAIREAYIAAGIAFGSTFPVLLQGFAGAFVYHFNIRSPEAEKWLREKSSSFITRITEETRELVRNIAQEGMAAGRNPRRVALDIVGRIDPVTRRRVGGIIGLTVEQMTWVRATRRDLEELNPRYFQRKLRDKRFDRVVQRAINTGQPLDTATVQRLMTRYTDNVLKFRAEMIARSELLQAQSAAEFEATRQAVDLGATTPSSVRRVWDSSGDARVRPSHKAMDGQTVGFNEPFLTPEGARLMYPGDNSLGAPAKEIIMCRCRARPKINWTVPT